MGETAFTPQSLLLSFDDMLLSLSDKGSENLGFRVNSAFLLIPVRTLYDITDGI